MKPITVAGRRVLITGASSGIGRATALLVARRGGTALLLARRADELDKLRAEIEESGGKAECYPCDLNDFEQIDRVADEVGRVDVLVNNAGRSIRRSIRLSLDRFHDYDRTMRLNYFAPLRLILKLLPGMIDRGEGHVVNVTSQAIQVHSPRFSAYTASKAALEQFGRCANREFGADNITFTSVRMPLVRTPMIAQSKAAYRGMPSWSADQAAKLVLKGIHRRTDVVYGPAGVFIDLVDTLLPGVARRGMQYYHRLFPETAPETGKITQ
nr:SDR family NAD(P)-dependent oxidoreductase [Kibdelosporangium sp. MJ126-NF4]CEL15573.1 Putative oxidoreductase [Kibdelosporangium sp. MJ126-NF4]CTQ98237.1 Putative oxidoreductase [Kibdelosporangium sp. MJ126-NF4]